MNSLIPIVMEEKRVLTTAQLAKGYETTERRISENFNSNKERYILSKHYYLLEGEQLKEFKSQYGNSVVPLSTSKLYVWTEKGALLHAKSLNTDKAWEVYDKLVETYFRVKEIKNNIDELSPQLQLLINMELEQKKIQQEIIIAKEETAAVKQEVNDIREVVEIRPSQNWRKDTNIIMKKICKKVNDYKLPKEEAYKAINERARVDLKRRLENMRARLLLNGGSKTKANNLNYLDVIGEDIKLIEIYTNIVKEMAIKYKVA